MNPLLWLIQLPFRKGQERWDRQNPSVQAPAPGDTRVPAPDPVPGTTVPSVPQAAEAPSRQSPAPALTPRETRRLANLDQWATECDPMRRQSAEVLADNFRQLFPHLPDDDLGRVLLHASEIALAYGMNGAGGRLSGTLGLAAAELTRLTRTEVLDARD